MEKSDEKLIVPEEFKNVINDFVSLFGLVS